MSYWVMGTMIVSTLVSARASYTQGQTQQKIARNNQIMADYAATDAVRRGDEEAAALRRKGAQMKGAQRSRAAAAGLDLSEGTVAELQDQVDFFSEQDQRTSRDNAAREAWGLRQQGMNYRAQGDAAAQQGNLAALGTVLSGASQVAGKWYPSGNAAFGGTSKMPSETYKG